MILNNFYAMEYIREHHREDVTIEALLDIQRILTDRTLDDPDDVGRIQRPEDERIAVYHDPDNFVVHQPPPAEMLPERLQGLCDFANAQQPVPYVHPVIKSIVLHLWLAYDHPFADGNGRTARALFYWSMMKNGYWVSEFLSISKVLREGPTRYGRSFLYTETDAFDATYFILNQLSVIQRAFDELKSYLSRVTENIKRSEKQINSSGRFNGRQLALLRHALRHPGAEYTAKSHATSNRVTLQSARNDLADLQKQGLIVVGNRGRTLVYRPAPDLSTQLITD
jgi:Fic family protein